MKRLLAEVILQDDQLKAIGCVVVESSHLESYVEAIIKEMCGDEYVAEQLMFRKMLDNKIDIMKAIAEPWINTDDLRERFVSLCADIKADIVKRNTVVHGDWGAARLIPLSRLFELQADGDAIAVRKNAAAQVKARDVMNLALRFGDHQMNLVALWIEHRESKTSKKKSSRQAARPSQTGLRPRSQKNAKR